VSYILGPQNEVIEDRKVPDSSVASGTDRTVGFCPTCKQPFPEAASAEPGAEPTPFEADSVVGRCRSGTWRSLGAARLRGHSY